MRGYLGEVYKTGDTPRLLVGVQGNGTDAGDCSWLQSKDMQYRQGSQLAGMAATSMSKRDV